MLRFFLVNGGQGSGAWSISFSLALSGMPGDHADLIGPTTANRYTLLQAPPLSDLAHFLVGELLNGKPIWFTNSAFKNVNGAI